MADRLGIEFLSVFGLPPVEFVHLASDLGLHYISSGLGGAGYDPPLYPPYSLKDDPALRRETVAAMRDCDVSISLGEGMLVRPGVDVRDLASDLDLMLELGVRRVNTISLEPDLERTTEQVGILAAMAADRGLELTMETSPGFMPPDLPTALQIIGAVDRPDFKLLVDTMHIMRGGAVPADLTALDPGTIGYVQLSDVPLVSSGEMSYFEEAMHARMVPGTGELPLLELLDAIPRDVIVSLEVPQLALARAGVGPHERLGACVTAAQALLDRLDDAR